MNPWADCTDDCARPVPCPDCRRDLPPRGRSVPPEHYLPHCCQAHRYDAVNTRHLWTADERTTR